ncbi:MAG: tetratricopeptide repeat protein [Endomicrobium sp.]|nr:tetratricopeptide repeat protein [Endomicrobium sp.]
MTAILNFFKNNLKFSFICILIIVVFALYGKMLKYDFVYLDDDVLIIDRIETLKDYKIIPSYFYKSVFDVKTDKYYRPLLMLSFAIDAVAGGANPAVYRFTDLLLCLFAVFLIFFLLRELGFNEKIVFAFCILFAVCPAFVQAVAWIPGRNDTLLAVFVILSLISVVKYLNTGRLYWLVLHGSALLFSMFTKETAVGLIVIEPLMIFIIAIYSASCRQQLGCSRENGNPSLKNKLIADTAQLAAQRFIFYAKNAKTRLKGIVFAALLVSIIYALLRHEALKNTQLNISLIDSIKYIYNAMPSVLQYCDFIINPSRLNIIPQYLNIDAFSFVSFFVVLCAPLVCAFLLKQIRKPVIVFGLIWFFVFLIPTFVLPQNIYFSHRVYLPAVGIIIMYIETAGVLMSLFRQKAASVLFARGVFFILFFLFFGASFFQTEKFKNREIFWQNALIDSPNSSFVNANVAMFYVDNGFYDKAIEFFLKAIELNPANSLNYNNIGRAYLLKKEYLKSVPFFQKALQLNAYNEEALYNLSQIYFVTGDINEAYNLADKLINLNSKDEAYVKYYQKVKAAVDGQKR